ncbi:Protein of unknown function [Pyronema omphalodes CBS 100304]|uniref:Uncharacterized protein n=1 Tax=Pyronema omphalodes (strain CBS 100304) TaxID=1076935 RepID=U4LR31_PYROM|nr:Protein of unknown function [Pyronema omphalodes CBS 100304]
MDGIQDIAKKNIKYFTEKTPEQPDPLSKDAGCLFLFALVAIGFFGMMFYYCRNKARERAKKKTDKAKTVQEKAAKKAAKSGQCWPSHRQQKETDLEAQNNKVTEEEPRNPPPEIQVPENAYFADSPQVCIIRNSLGTQREKFYEILNAEKVPGYTPTPPPAYSPTRLKRLPTPPPQTLEESMQQCLENQRESCQDKTFEVIGGQIEMRVEDKTGRTEQHKGKHTEQHTKKHAEKNAEKHTEQLTGERKGKCAGEQTAGSIDDT